MRYAQDWLLEGQEGLAKRRHHVVSPTAARYCGPVKKFLASAVLRLSGWQVHGVAPDLDQCVVIAAPHTSNWDFVWMKLMAWSLNWDVNWLGKHTLFKGPAGAFMRSWGGVPVDRRGKQDLVSQVVARFAAGETLALTIPAEGTRDRSDTWRSGFYHIAHGAGVPVVLSFLDYAKKTGGIGPTVLLTGDTTADMNEIRQFYQGITGKFPELSGPILLREESQRARETGEIPSANPSDSSS